MSPKSSKHKRSEPFLSTVLNVGISLQKQLNNITVPLPTCKGKGAILIAIWLNIDLGSMIKQHGSYFHMTSQSCKHQSCTTIFSSVFNIRRPFQQQLHDGLVAKGASPSEGTVRSGLRGGINVGVVVQQITCHIDVSLTARLQQRCIPRLVSIVNMGSAFQQQLHDVEFALPTCQTHHFIQAHVRLGDRTEHGVRFVNKPRFNTFIVLFVARTHRPHETLCEISTKRNNLPWESEHQWRFSFDSVISLWPWEVYGKKHMSGKQWASNWGWRLKIEIRK